MKNAVKLDFTGTVGQYPKNNEENDVSLGQALNLDYTLSPGQNFRIKEKWIQYGDRMNITVGANYEVYF
jgi:hypothetical protein